jgi:hypothetical protein
LFGGLIHLICDLRSRGQQHGSPRMISQLCSPPMQAPPARPFYQLDGECVVPSAERHVSCIFTSHPSMGIQNRSEPVKFTVNRNPMPFPSSHLPSIPEREFFCLWNLQPNLPKTTEIPCWHSGRRTGSIRVSSDWLPAVRSHPVNPGRFSHSGYDEFRSQVESTYREMVQFSNTDYANHLN